MSQYLRKELSEGPTDLENVVVWLGDYIDRGLHPLECLDLVAAGLKEPGSSNVTGVTEIALRGNHEQFLLDVVDNPLPSQRWIDIWTMNGGQDTLDALLPGESWDRPEGLAALLRQAMGEERLAFLRARPLSYALGDYFFAHAGMNPRKSQEDQGEEDLLWIREPFLTGADWPFSVTVVHGHTPENPCCLPHRIGVDSGVFISGNLTAVELMGDQLRFITAEGRGHKANKGIFSRLLGAMGR